MDKFVDISRDHLMEFATRSWIEIAPALVASIQSDLLALQPGDTLGGVPLEDPRDPDVPLDSRSPSANDLRPRSPPRLRSPPSASAPDVPAVSQPSLTEPPLADSTASAPPQAPSESIVNGNPRKRPRPAQKLTPEVVVPPVSQKRLKNLEASSSNLPPSADADDPRAHLLNFALHDVSEADRLRLILTGEAVESEQPLDWGIVRRRPFSPSPSSTPSPSVSALPIAEEGLPPRSWGQAAVRPLFLLPLRDEIRLPSLGEEEGKGKGKAQAQAQAQDRRSWPHHSPEHSPPPRTSPRPRVHSRAGPVSPLPSAAQWRSLRPRFVHGSTCGR